MACDDLSDASTAQAQQLTMQKRLRRSQFTVHAREVMRPEAHAYYGINAEMAFKRQKSFYAIQVHMHPYTGTLGKECPHTLRHVVQSVAARIAALQGYAYYAFGEPATSEISHTGHGQKGAQHAVARMFCFCCLAEARFPQDLPTHMAVQWTAPMRTTVTSPISRDLLCDGFL